MKHLVYSIALLMLFGVFVGCGNDDDDTTSEFATIHGVITFDNTDLWPDGGELQVTIFAEGAWVDVGDQRVPTGAPYNATNPVVLEKIPGQNQYEYQIDGLAPGTYSALAVGWRPPNADELPATQRTATLGCHWDNPNEVSTGLRVPLPPPAPSIDDPAPAPITVAAGDDLEINFRADFIIVPAWFPQYAQQ